MKRILLLLAFLLLPCAAEANNYVYYGHGYYRHRHVRPYYPLVPPPVIVVPPPPVVYVPPRCEYGNWQDAHGRIVTGTACLYADGWHLQ